MQKQLQSNPQRLWKEPKKIGITRKKQNALPKEVRNEDGEVVAGRSNIKGVWGAYFEKLLNPNNQPTQSNPVETHGTVLGSGKTSEASQSLLNKEVEEEEVSMALNQLKIRKAAGNDEIIAENDEIIAEMLRHPRCLKVTAALFKKCFQGEKHTNSVACWHNSTHPKTRNQRSNGPKPVQRNNLAVCNVQSLL